MSRSYKKPILQDRPRNYKISSYYWRPIRRIWKQIINKFMDNPIEDIQVKKEITLPDPKEIINDYDYCDWITSGYIFTDDEFITKNSRK